MLELESNNEVAGELGPLQYLSGLTGTPMDKIINILLLIIIFVFDPLAISLVVAANFAFDKAYPKRKYRENLYGEDVEVKPLSFKEEREQYIKNHGKHWDDKINIKNYGDDEEKRMDIIGQNGNDGEHYFDELDLNKDGIVDDSEIGEAKKRISELEESILNSGITKSSNRVDKALQEVKKLKGIVSDLEDDETKTY